MTEVRELEKAISSIVIDRGGTYPADWAGLGITVPKDPWGRDYVYSLPVRGVFGPDTINGDFDLYSKGADGLSEDDIDDPTSQDDVVRAGDGGFVGLVSNFLP